VLELTKQIQGSRLEFELRPGYTVILVYLFMENQHASICSDFNFFLLWLFYIRTLGANLITTAM